MSTTIVDALIVTLGLDGAKLKAGAKVANEDMRKLSSESDRSAKLMEAKGKQAAQFYTKIRNEALGLIAVFTGGRAIKNFVEDTIGGAAALGQMATNLQISTEHLSAWQRANERAGGSAQGMTAQLLESQAAAAKYSMGMSDESMQWFYRMGGSDKALKDGNTYLLARADIIANKFKTDPAQAKLIAQQMGIAPEQFDLMKRGSAAMMALVAAQEKNSAVTKEGAARALELRNKMLDLRDRLEYTATTILLRLAPALERGAAKLEKMANWVADHKDDISAWVDKAVRAIGSFISMLDRAAQAVGGWQNVLIALAALKVLSMVASLFSLASALGGVGSALGLIGGGAAAAEVLGTIGAAAGTAALAVGALGLAVVGMSAAIQALDPEVDPKNHPGKRRVRARGHADEWVTDLTLPQAHVGEHYIRGGRGGSWVKDEAPTVKKPLTPAEKSAEENKYIPAWVSKFFGGHGSSSRFKVAPPAPMPVSPSPAATDAAGDVTRKLMAQGWTKEQAAGMVGSLQQESGLNPAAVNPKSGAYGIGQWLGSRVGDFKKFSGKDLAGSTLDEQLAFHQYELTKGNERAAGDKLRAARTAEEAARIHSQAYERPGEDEANVARRQQNAAAILDQMKTANAAAAARLPGQATSSAQGGARAPQGVTQTSETNFTGPVTINTQAKDAEGIARAFGKEMSKFGFVPQANTGMV